MEDDKHADSQLFLFCSLTRLQHFFLKACFVFLIPSADNLLSTSMCESMYNMLQYSNMHVISSLESLSAFWSFSEDHRHVADAEKAQCRLTFIGSWAAGVLNADTPEVRA